jgi:hypothetical protein
VSGKRQRKQAVGKARWARTRIRATAERVKENKGSNTEYPATIDAQAHKFNSAKIERKCEAKRGVGTMI